MPVGLNCTTYEKSWLKFANNMVEGAPLRCMYLAVYRNLPKKATPIDAETLSHTPLDLLLYYQACHMYDSYFGWQISEQAHLILSF